MKQKPSVQLYSIQESAKRLGISLHTMRQLVEGRKLPVVIFRQRVRISDEALRRFTAKHTFMAQENLQAELSC